jgi:hypothetical protein
MTCDNVGGLLCDSIDLLRGAVALLDRSPHLDGDDDLLAARRLASLALERVVDAQALDLTP